MAGRPPHAGGGPPSAAARPPGIPPHPQTLDGAAVLHQMFGFDRKAWRMLDGGERQEIASEASSVLHGMEDNDTGGSAVFSLLGHKGDLLAVHFRPDLEQVHRAELDVANLRLAEFLTPTTSYVSVVELGLYDSSYRLYQELAEQEISPDSDQWAQRVRTRMDEQAAAMAPRLDPSVPAHKYLCFYPMDKKRGEQINWYTRPIRERLQMMREHGMIGRRYAGRVKQIISGSIGFDDWEWGVDLFADDPLVFKELIYEMRFDEASAVYADFGPFYISIRLPVAELANWLDASNPQFGTVAP